MKAESKPRSRGISRRAVLQSAGIASTVGLAAWKTGILLPADSKGVRIEAVSYGFEEYLYRTPYKFGGRAVDRVTLLNVRCRVRSVDGRDSNGFGSMSLGNVWSFPSKVMSYDTTLGAMKYLAERISRLTSDYREFGHPIDINHALEPHYLKAALIASAQLKLASPIPKLCTLVTASPFDAAIHDAYGK